MRPIHSRRRALGTALGLVALSVFATAADAVRLNPDGTGQVLLFPYYTTRGGNQTIFTIVNQSDRYKALNVRLNEGRNGRAVLSFNLYLSPHDTWTGTLFELDGPYPANLLPTDPSCVFPTFDFGQLPDGRGYEPLHNMNYHDDAGPDGPERSAEGTIVVIEAGNLDPSSPPARAIATSSSPDAPNGCGVIGQTWAQVWNNTPNQYLTNPTGGLSGEAMVLNVMQGTVMGYAATALDDFRTDPADLPAGSRSTVVAHFSSFSLRPTLADAVNDPAASTARASIDLKYRRLELDYPTTRAIDAVSAVLMADTASMNYSSDPQAGATTDWIIALPTKPFYSDSAIVGGTAIQPFSGLYPGVGDLGENTATEWASFTLYDRKGRRIPPGAGAASKLALPYVTQAVSIAPRIEGSAVPPNAGPLASVLVSQMPPVSGNAQLDGGGLLELNLRSSVSGNRSLRPSSDGTVLYGLPAIGFAAVNYINSNSGFAAAANYSLAKPQRRTQECRRNTLNCDVAGSGSNTQ